jgi:hypothetical protein
MLFRKEFLDRIKAGKITLAFRKWKRPNVKAGGTILTRVGVIGIDAVEMVDIDHISADDFREAGIEDLERWKDGLDRRQGDLYRIKLRWVEEDPRIELRKKTDLGKVEFSALYRKLEKMDQRSTRGPWAFRIMELIESNPGKLAQLLANEMGVEKSWLKPNIRKLKALGLTISLEVGYQLSPRGEAFMSLLREQNSLG